VVLMSWCRLTTSTIASMTGRAVSIRCARMLG
jgi:hypothetical protein